MDFVLDSELLIPEVERHPCLWDSTRADYVDRDVKARAWHNISVAINPDLAEYERTDFIKEVQKRWKCVRDACLKSVKRSKYENLVGGHRPRKRRPYVYMKQLKFILPFLEHQKTLIDHSEDPSMIYTPTQSNEDSASGNEGPMLPSSPIRKQKEFQESSSDNSLPQMPLSPSTTNLSFSDTNFNISATTSSNSAAIYSSKRRRHCSTAMATSETHDDAPPSSLNSRRNGFYVCDQPAASPSYSRFDLLGRNWCEKMKTLTNEQRIFAEKLVNDVFYEAELGRLGRGCHVVVSSSS